MQLEQLLTTIEALTGLEASVYPANPSLIPASLDALPTGHRRHMSAFCRLVKGGDPRGCKGHDSFLTNQRAGVIGQPFVQRCHAGVAEVIVPVFGDGQHLATVFIGQVATEAVQRDGIEEIGRRLNGRGIDRDALRRVYTDLPRMSENELLQIGRLTDCALRGMVETMSNDMLERQLRIQAFPQVRNALRILETEKRWDVTQAQMARRVHVSVAYFSRLFKRVTGVTYSDYLTALRMREAQNLLHQTRIGVNEIARKIGYSRQSYFTRRFQALTGMTPSEYRCGGAG